MDPVRKENIDIHTTSSDEPMIQKWRQHLNEKSLWYITIITNIIFGYWMFVTYDFSNRYVKDSSRALHRGWMFGRLVVMIVHEG
jgi:hypothetical protein